VTCRVRTYRPWGCWCWSSSAATPGSHDIPLIPLLLLAYAPRTPGFRILDLGLAAVWAVSTAALVAHLITTPRDRHAIHTRFSLPVVGGPFIACISLQANGWHVLAQGLFTVGVYLAVTFGSLIVSRLMTEQRLTDVRFPTLAVLMVPPATASTAWFGLNDNRITSFGIGLAAVLAMMALIQLFILPDYLRRPFTISWWSFSFPLASVANTVGHWAIAAPVPASQLLTWSTLIIATAIIGLLAVLTVRMVWRTSGLILSLPIPGISAAYPVDPRRAEGRYMAPPRQLSANHRRGRMP
jgi:tellurite resistance protein